MDREYSRLTAVQESALWGMLIADSVSMPIHWYYDVNDIKKDFGWLNWYRTPKKIHPSSILNLSAKDGSGRSIWKPSQCASVIGNVILHDKLQYWDNPKCTTHYHQGLEAGDNTLNALCAIRVTHVLHKNMCSRLSDRELRALVLEEYVKFMTTPGSHNDIYAESFHRSFFKDWNDLSPPPTSAKEILKFSEERYVRLVDAQEEDKQLAVIGSFVMAIPWIVFNAHRPIEECVSCAVEFVKLTHPVKSLVPFVEQYSRLLYSVLNGASLKEAVVQCLNSNVLGHNKETIHEYFTETARYSHNSEDRINLYQKATSSLGIACYIKGSLSSLLFLAHEFYEDFEGGILTNANVGGENCHRGSALGALLGASTAHNNQHIPHKWKEALNTKEDLTCLLN